MSRQSRRNDPIVVIGDALLDVDIVGSSTRLAPDAPVPVVDNPQEHVRPGGAALAASLLARDGHDVVFVTALGDDGASRQLRTLLTGVEIVAGTLNGELPRKVRIRSGNQSLTRLDYGGARPAAPIVDPVSVRTHLGRAAAVLVSDYGRGLSTALHPLLADAARSTPLVWDPHPRGSVPVRGAAAVTPNVAEARAFAGVNEPLRPRIVNDVAPLAADLARLWRARCVCVTLGASGALISFGDESPVLIPAPRVPGLDCCGAGDRFAGAFVAAIAYGALPTEAASAAVNAASEFVAAGGASDLAFDPSLAAVGAARRTPGDFENGEVFSRVWAARSRGATIVGTGGCFDLLHAGHVETLRAARGLGDFLVVCLNSDASVARLKGPSRPLVPARDRARILAALSFVDDVVVFDDDTPTAVLDRLRPDLWVKGGDYDERTLPEADTVRKHGGQVVCLPYLDGWSTTELVMRASATRAARAESFEGGVGESR